MFQKFQKSFKGLAYGEFFKEVSPITEINIFVQIQANFFFSITNLTRRSNLTAGVGKIRSALQSNFEKSTTLKTEDDDGGDADNDDDNDDDAED